MRRRNLVVLLSAVTALGLPTAWAQEKLPVIGFLHQGTQPPATLMKAFADGLSGMEIREGRDVRIEHRAADGHYDRLPGLVEDLVTQHVAVITADFLPASLAAKAATQTIPIVFLTGSDPIAAGLVSSFSRPTGNVTGIAFMFTRLGPKNLEFLHELLPNIPVVAVLTNQTNPNGPPQMEDLQTAARSLGLQLEIFDTSTPDEIDDAIRAAGGTAHRRGGYYRRWLHDCPSRSAGCSGSPLCGADNLSFKPICDGRRFDELRGQPSGCIPRNRNLRRKNTQGRETC
jgi:putative ABC transport system substrate-binding protein